MRALSEMDVPARLAPAIPRWVSEILCAVGCAGAAAVLRVIADAVIPGSAPFVFVFPALLLATLAGGWRAGLIALVLMEAMIWRVVLAPHLNAGGPTDEQFATLATNLVSAGLVVLIAAGFRAAALHVETQRADQIEQHDLLLRELNHRIKNNFQMVAGLLELQRRAAPDPNVAQALEGVIQRVLGMAHAHASLYQPSLDVGSVDLDRYLGDLCRDLADSLLLNTLVQLTCHCEPAVVSPDRGVEIGIIVNELVTNAAKYAFPDGRSGTIAVTFVRTGSGWRLTVADDGVGLDGAGAGGLGRRLVEAFARQAGGKLVTGKGPGAVLMLDLPADRATARL